MQIIAPSAGAAAHRTAIWIYEYRASDWNEEKSIYRSSELAVQRDLVAVG